MQCRLSSHCEYSTVKNFSLLITVAVSINFGFIQLTDHWYKAKVYRHIEQSWKSARPFFTFVTGRSKCLTVLQLDGDGRQHVTAGSVSCSCNRPKSEHSRFIWRIVTRRAATTDRRTQTTDCVSRAKDEYLSRHMFWYKLSYYLTFQQYTLFTAQLLLIQPLGCHTLINDSRNDSRTLCVSAVFAVARCLSVNAGIVSKRIKISSNFFSAL